MTHIGAPASRCECSMTRYRPSGVIESREKDLVRDTRGLVVKFECSAQLR
jgi:hypothetical protein